MSGNFWGRCIHIDDDNNRGGGGGLFNVGVNGLLLVEAVTMFLHEHVAVIAYVRGRNSLYVNGLGKFERL